VVSPELVPFACLCDVYKGYGAKEVLRGLTLDVMPGETLVILGGSGSGKSVTLRHIIGLEQPDAGIVKVEGQEVQDLHEDDLFEIRRKVGFLFQGGALFDSMNVFENIAFPLGKAGWDAEEIIARVNEVLGYVDLDPDVGDLMPSSLSGGMKKRVALARAIAVAPRGILYDEPTTGLDPITSTTINDLIRSMQQRLGVTSIVVTHDIGSAFRVADRVAFLNQGRIRFLGTVEQAHSSGDPKLAAFIEGRAEGEHDGR
jgi:phospholipid/cholesterol/gamma-HCH transport system ATP-binding protein